MLYRESPGHMPSIDLCEPYAGAFVYFKNTFDIYWPVDVPAQMPGSSMCWLAALWKEWNQTVMYVTGKI